jgi:lysophospholipase L1-like esterase
MTNLFKFTLLYILSLFCLLSGAFYISEISAKQSLELNHIDSVLSPIDTLTNVDGKTALFIGDSHTANNKNGWQVLVCKKTGLKMNNTSISGKTTYWMLDVAVYAINKNIDYCFIYGGANDMYSSSISPEEAIANIQSIVKLCRAHNIRPVVLTGFDPNLTRTTNKNYIPKYVKFQKLLLTSLKGATVIDTRVISKKDCWDGLCHMSPSGHAKIADKVISDMKFMKK